MSTIFPAYADCLTPDFLTLSTAMPHKNLLEQRIELRKREPLDRVPVGHIFSPVGCLTSYNQ